MPSSSLPTPGHLPADPVLLPAGFAVQHNALVNARFYATTLEMRLFLVLLGRVRRQDTRFKDCTLLVRELAPPGSPHLPYAEVAAMVKGLARRAIDVELVDTEGRRQPELGLTSIPLFSVVSYVPASGQVIARFNEEMRPYLLELKANFTKAEIQQLHKLKSAASFRIYWLLKEYATFGYRTLALAELRHLLGLTTEYAGRLDHFRTRVLDRAQQELARTDLPFTYELIQQGRKVTQVRFVFAPLRSSSTAASGNKAALGGWEATLLAAGVAKRSLATIHAQLAAGIYDEGYISYVLNWVKNQATQGRVKKPAGAIYQALRDGYLVKEYQQQRQAAAATAKPTKTVGRRHLDQRKLQSELEDAQNSLQWFQQPAAAAYYAQRHPTQPALFRQHQAAATAKVTELEQKLGM